MISDSPHRKFFSNTHITALARYVFGHMNKALDAVSVCIKSSIILQGFFLGRVLSEIIVSVIVPSFCVRSSHLVLLTILSSQSGWD